MTAVMNNADTYIDFFDIAVEAYRDKKIDIYRKLMVTLIASYKKLLHEIEIANSELEKVDSLGVDEDKLELFYDNLYDALDLIKLLKSHILPLKDEDGLFIELYQVIDKLHDALVLHLDIISMQEVRAIQKEYI